LRLPASGVRMVSERRRSRRRPVHEAERPDLVYTRTGSPPGTARSQPYLDGHTGETGGGVSGVGVEVTPQLTARPVSVSASEYSEIALPNDANPMGNLLGGRVMHLVDL